MTYTLLTLTVLRKKMSLTQEDLARLVKKSQPEISLYETGENIPAHVAERLYKAMSKDDPGLMKSYVPEDLAKPWDEMLLRSAAT